MTMAEQRQRSDILYRMEAQLTGSVPVGVLPEGLRVDNSFEGVITEGAFAGAEVRGIDYYLIRPDGVGVVDAREVILTGQHAIGAIARGYVIPPAGMPLPPLEMLLSPDFEWPDVPFDIHVFQTFSTAAPDLAHLNRTIVSHLGGVNYATRKLVVDARVLEPFNGRGMGGGDATRQFTAVSASH
jgi:hypothetical protein